MNIHLNSGEQLIMVTRMQVVPKKVDVPSELVFLTEHLENSPVTAHDIQVWTRRDPELARALQYIWQGWPEEVDAQLNRYHSK